MIARWDLDWIVALVVMGVYALSWVLKAKDQGEQKAQQPNRRNPGQELDRFLQEIDRLRKQQEARGPSKPRMESEAEEELETIMPTRPAPVRETKIVTLLPPPMVFRPPTLPTAPAAPVFVEAPPNRTPQIIKVPEPPRRRGPNAASVAVSLLTNPRTVASAFALNEILGPPKCKRRSG